MVDGDNTQDAFVPQLHAAVDPTDLDLDDVFEVLAHFRRRSVLYALTMDDQWTLSTLATTLAAWENTDDEDTVDENMHERMYISLYHTHIPKLEKAKAVHFDKESGMLAPDTYTDTVLAVLEAVSDSLNQREGGPQVDRNVESTQYAPSR